MPHLKGFRKRLTRSGLAVGLFAAGFLVLLPILLPVAVIQNQLRNRRILKLARDLDCASCGARLGAEAIQLGAQRWAAIVARHHEMYPFAKLRLVRDVDAVCPRCGCEYSYRDNALRVRIDTPPDIVDAQQRKTQPKLTGNG